MTHNISMSLQNSFQSHFSYYTAWTYNLRAIKKAGEPAFCSRKILPDLLIILNHNIRKF